MFPRPAAIRPQTCCFVFLRVWIQHEERVDIFKVWSVCDAWCQRAVRHASFTGHTRCSDIPFRREPANYGEQTVTMLRPRSKLQLEKNQKWTLSFQFGLSPHTRKLKPFECQLYDYVNSENPVCFCDKRKYLIYFDSYSCGTLPRNQNMGFSASCLLGEYSKNFLNFPSEGSRPKRWLLKHLGRPCGGDLRATNLCSLQQR